MTRYHPSSSHLQLQVKAAHMTLFLRRGGDPVPEEIGTEDDKTLGAYGVQV